MEWGRFEVLTEGETVLVTVVLRGLDIFRILIWFGGVGLVSSSSLPTIGSDLDWIDSF